MEVKEKDLDRFWSHVEKSEDPTGCWLWVGRKNKYDDYGQFYCQRKLWVAHRYEVIGI